MVQKSAPKGRPRSFDADQVLASVRDTFWRHGYAGTSMDQLSAATGLHKPSLYGAFGDKRRLYLESLDRYLAEARAEFGAALSRPRLIDSLTELFGRSILLFTRGDGGATGCFMVSTAIPVAGEDPEILAIVRAAMDELDRALVRRFEAAIAAGELPQGADPRALARIVSSSHYEIGARARAGYERAQLERLAAQTVELVRDFGGAAG